MSAIHRKCLLGQRLTSEVLLDCHAHIGRSCDYRITDGEPEQLAAEMQRLNIRGTFAFQFTGVRTGEVEYGNDTVADAMRRVPGRLLGLCMVNLRFAKDLEPELERCRQLGFVGVKLIPHYQNYPENGPLVEAPCTFAHDNAMPILNHHWGDNLEDLLQRFPKAQFICGHFDPARAELVARYDNLWVCTCLPTGFQSFERAMRTLREDRVMWGSDMSDLSFGLGLGPIVFGRLSDEVKRKVLGLNMKELLERCNIPVPAAYEESGSEETEA